MTALAAPRAARLRRDANDASRFALAAGAALIAHVIVALLMSLNGASHPAPPFMEAVPVEIATQAEIDALTRPLASPRPASPDPRSWRDERLAAIPPPNLAAPPLETPPPRVRETVHATQMLSAEVLAHQRSRAMASFLRSLDAEERLIQLCNIEAMAQIARRYDEFRPDRVVAYAGAETKASGESLTAPRAAFHSNGDWIDFSYVCRASRDRKTIVGFEFSVGESIPRRDWAAKRLPAER